MGVHDMRCPKCGKQSTEYDENKWQCLHCGNRFVYKEESPTYHSQTNVHLETSSLFDLEPYDSGNERPIEEPYLNRIPLEEDDLWKELDDIYVIRDGWTKWLLILMTISLILLVPGAAYNPEPGFLLLLFPMVVFFYLMRVVSRGKKEIKAKREEREAHLRSRMKIVGWVALCPSCKEEHSRYLDDEKDLTSAPVHCQADSCGKQFMLLNGKARVIKR